MGYLGTKCLGVMDFLFVFNSLCGPHPKRICEGILGKENRKRLVLLDVLVLCGAVPVHDCRRTGTGVTPKVGAPEPV